MNKMIMTVAIVCAAFVARAASVDWKVTGAAADVGTTVYLLTSISAEGYADAVALADAAIDSAEIIKSGRTYGTGDQTASGEAVTKTSPYYLAVFTEGNNYFTYVEASGMASFVYDPASQESSSGKFDALSASQLANGTKVDFTAVPEPTSGLLLLLGMAGLALRRKQK